MNYKCKAAIKRSIAFLLVMALMWSESSIVTLASAVTPQTGVEEGAGEPAAEPADEPSEEPEATPDAEPTATPAQNETENDQTGATPTPTADQTGEESAEPTATPEEGQEEGQDPSATPTPSATPESSPSASPSASPDGVLTVALNANGEGASVSLADAYVVKVQDKDGNGITIPSDDAPKVPNGVKISLYQKATKEGVSDVLIDLDDVDRLEWYILIGDVMNGEISEDAEPVLINEETLVLDEYTLLETSKVVVRLCPNPKEEDQEEGTGENAEENTDPADFDCGYYTATEAKVDGDKAAITNTGSRIEAGSRLALTAKSGTITECYWFRAESSETEAATSDDTEIMLSAASDYAKTSYRITSADVAENVKSIYAKYKLAGDNTLYKTAELSMTERREASAKVVDVSRTEGSTIEEALSIEDVYVGAPIISHASGSGYKNSYNLVVNRNRSKWEGTDGSAKFGAEFELTFEEPVSSLTLACKYFTGNSNGAYYPDACISSSKQDTDGFVWRVNFEVNEDVIDFGPSKDILLGHLLAISNGSNTITYKDGTKGEFNLYVHDIGNTEDEIYLAELVKPESTSSTYGVYKEYTLNRVDSLDAYVGESEEYVLVQNGRPYKGSITVGGAAVTAGWIDCTILPTDEYGFTPLRITGKKSTQDEENKIYYAKQLTISDQDLNKQLFETHVVVLTSYSSYSSGDVAWVFENADDIGDYEKSLNAKSDKTRVFYGGGPVDYYIMMNPGVTDRKLSSTRKPELLNANSCTMTSSFLTTANGTPYYKCTVTYKGNGNIVGFPYSLFRVYFTDESGYTTDCITDYLGIISMKGDATGYPFLKGIGSGTPLTMPDCNYVLASDGTATDFVLALPEGKTVKNITLMQDYKRNGTVEITSDDKTCFTVTPKQENMTVGFTISVSDGKTTSRYQILMSPGTAACNGGSYEAQTVRYFFGIEAEGSESNSMVYINRTSAEAEPQETGLKPAMQLFDKAEDGSSNTLVEEGEWFCPFLKSVKAEIIAQLADPVEGESQGDGDVVWFMNGETKTKVLTFDSAERSTPKDYKAELYSGNATGTALIKYTYTFKSDTTVPAALRGKTYAGRVMQVQVIDPEESGSITEPTFITDENLTEEQKEENATLLQTYLNALMAASEENDNEVIDVSLSTPVQFKGTITLNTNVRLHASSSTLTGSLVVEQADGGRTAEIYGLNMVSGESKGTLVDASEGAVKLYDCDFEVSGATLISVSGDTCAETGFYENCTVTFASTDNTLLAVSSGKTQVTGNYHMDNLDLIVSADNDVNVKLVSAAEGSAAVGATFDVAGLRVTNITSLNALNNGGSVVNNVFEVQDESNSYANDADVTLTTANNFWMMPDVKGDSEKRIKQIQVQSGDYQVSDIPDNIDWAFRPYAAVDEYPGKTAGAYASLLPKNYQKYVVFDVKQKSGFPYGATLTKSVAVEPEFTEGYILQYHADKTTEVVALITTDKVTAVEGSVLKEITAADGVYQLGVDTSNGENEPVVLAFYTGAPEVGFTMKVTGNIDEESGYLLTDTDRELRVVLNGGIGTNYFNDASGENINFALDNSKSSMPDGEKITLEVDEDNENIATIHVPAGTSGSFTLTGFYQAKEGKTISGNSAGKNVQTASVTVNMVGVQNVEADGVPYSALGSKYYGELTFVVNKDTVSAITDISILAGEDGEGGYGCELVSTTIADDEEWAGYKKKDRKAYTIQYMVNVGDSETWQKIDENLPVIRLETVAGQLDIPLETRGADLTCVDAENGLTYLFEKSSEETLGKKQVGYDYSTKTAIYEPTYDPVTDADTLIFTGALITAPATYYSNPNGTTMRIPGTVTLDGTDYTVKYLKNGCLNEVWDNGAQRNAPKIVEISANAEILHLNDNGVRSVSSSGYQLVTDQGASDIEKFVVTDGNEHFMTDKDGVGLYYRDTWNCYLLEVASAYSGSLTIHPEMDDIASGVDFSKITGFICDDSGCYQTIDGFLVESWTDWDSCDDETGEYLIRGYSLEAVPEASIGDTLVVPEGVSYLSSYCLKNIDISTLILPSTIRKVDFWNSDLQISDIYCYNTDLTYNPFASSYVWSLPEGVTFHGYVDKTGNSPLKKWVATGKRYGLKFSAMSDQGSLPEYAVTSSSLKPKTVATGELKGEQYYEVLVGQTLDADFNLNVVLSDAYTERLVNYTVEWDQKAYDTVGDEFTAITASETDNTVTGWTAKNCGVAKVNVMVDGNEDPVKSVYFVVRPASFELTVGSENTTIMFGESGTFNGRGLGTCGQEGTVSSDAVTVSKAAFDEWQSLGLASVLIPAERAVTSSDGKAVYDVWEIAQSDENALELTVQPLLYQKKDGTVLGAGTSSVGFELFGQECSTQVTACATKGTVNLYAGDTSADGSTTLYVEGQVLTTRLWRTYSGTDTKDESKTISLTECLDPQNGTYVSDEYSYEQFSCEVIEGMELLKDATIGTMTTTAGESGVATLQLTPNDIGKTGKAKVKVTLLYDDRAYSEIFDVIVADRSVIKELNVSAELYLKDKSSVENENGAETFNKDTNELKLVYGGEGSCWSLKELKITDEEEGEISQDLLDFKLTSDTGKAEWITDQSGSKTGIKLTGAGIAVVTITAMDANAATIRCVINVRDTQPKLINSDATLNKQLADATAEYRFAVPEGYKITVAEITEARLIPQKGSTASPDAKDSFVAGINDAGDTVTVKIVNDPIASLAAGSYQLTVKATVDQEASESGSAEEYNYSLTLKVTDATPKLTVTAADTINLNSDKGVSLTTLIDGVEAEDVTLSFDTLDAKVTANFAKCFELKKDEESGEYSVVLKDMTVDGNEQATPETLVKQFNNKDIVLKVAKNGTNLGTAKVRLKLAYTAPKLTLEDRGTVKVNTADFDSYEETVEAGSKRGGYSVRVDYTLSDDFELKLDKVPGSDPEKKQSVTIFEWKDKNQFNKYKDDIKFITDGDKFSVWVAADLPKGTYKFEMTPVVTVEGNSNLGDLTLAKQTLTVSVTQTTIKASLSDNKVTLDKNYIYTTADLKLLLDDSQFSSLYGSDYWSEGLDTTKTVAGITLTKAPKNVNTDSTGICFSVDESGLVTAQIDSTDVKSIVPGTYTYSIIPYLKICKWVDKESEESIVKESYILALAPLTFTVNVTDTLPTVQLEKNAVTISNADTSSSVLLNWKVTKGNYAAINAGTNNGWVALTKPADSPNAPEVTCEGNTVRIKATAQTLKGTYEYTITPEVTLDCSEDETNIKDVKPVTLKVTVKGDRPAAKLSKNKLVTNTWYPGTINAEPESVTGDVPESATAVITAGNYKITDVTFKPADKKAQELLSNNANAIRFAFDKDEPTIMAVPDSSTRKGSYSFYAYVTAADVGALEPVKFTVEVSDKKPDVKLASTNAQLKTNYASAVTLQLKDASAVVESAAEQTSYLIKKSGNWTLVPSGKAAVSQAYAVITTDADGSVTVSTGKKASTLAKSETVKMELTQKIRLKGNKTPYEFTSKLTIKFDATLPTTVISQKKVELNINTMEGYLPNVVNISTSAGNEIESVGITIGKCPDSGAFTLSYEPVTDGSMNISLSANRGISGLKTGSYSYTLTPKIRNNAGDLISLKPVTLTFSVVNKQPDVKLGKTSLTLNRLDTRDVSRQTITLTPTIADAEITYEAAVTDAKGTSVDSELLLPYGTFVGNGDDLKIGVTDTYMSDGKYKVNITPTLHRKDGTEVTLKTKTVNVTVNTPVVKAAFQNAKMTIDIADTAVKKQRNTITFTGTNAELINKVYGTWKLTKKPKDAGNNELWIDDLWCEDNQDIDGKEFDVCWGDDTSTWVNVTPGTYEFTFTPEGIEAEDGVEIKAPAALKLSVTVKKSVPTYKLTKSSVKVNAAFGQYETVAAKMSGTGWKLNHVGSVLTGTPGWVSTKDALVDVYYDNAAGVLYAHADAKAVEGKYTFRLTPEAEKNGVTVPLASQKLTVEVKNETPKAKLSGSTLALNTQYAEYYDNDEFGGNRVAVLSLNKNYGDSTFSNVTSEGGKTKVAFTGKAEQKKEANKIFWKLGEDGKLFAGISDESIKPGSYKFSITPTIRCSETGVVLSLNTINVTVRVTDQEIKATAKASGKLDLLERSAAGAITYTISLSDATLDTFAESETFSLQDVPEAPEAADSFEIVSGSVSNEGATATFKVCAKEGAELSTKTTYKLQIVVNTKNGKTCYVPVSIKPTQSTVRLTADTKAVTLYKQCAESAAPVITASAVSGAKPPKALTITEVTSGNKDFVIEFMGGEEKSRFRLVFASPAAKAEYKAGAKVKVPVYVTVKDQAVETVNKLEITVTVQ